MSEGKQEVAPVVFTNEQVELLKRTVAKGASDDELRLFAMICRRTGLDPFARQIHAIKRWNSETQREDMVIQTGIDGLRLIAERTGRYAPGDAPTYQYADDNSLLAATAYVKKQTLDGTWHVVAATARYDEYVQKRRGGDVTIFWKRMPHGQLAKCAEALALRRAFPQETSGLYTHDEMQQAEPADEQSGGAPALPHTNGGASVEFKGARYQTGGITQDTFDKVQAMCKRVGRDCATTVLTSFNVGGVLELSEAQGVEYIAALERAEEGGDTGADSVP